MRIILRNGAIIHLRPGSNIVGDRHRTRTQAPYVMVDDCLVCIDAENVQHVLTASDIKQIERVII